MYLIGAVAVGLFGFLYFGMLDTAIPSAVFIAIVLSLIPHDMQYGPQAALIAEAFTPRLRYSGASLGYQLASMIAGGPAPLIATALFAAYHSGYAIAVYIAACAVVSLVAAAFMPDYTGQDISMEMTTDAKRSGRAFERAWARSGPLGCRVMPPEGGRKLRDHRNLPLAATGSTSTILSPRTAITTSSIMLTTTHT